MDPRATILSVDDLPENLYAIDAMLAPLGLDVVSASSGPQALELASRLDFAVVLLDVMMPGMSGFDVLARLRETPRAAHTPVILITAREMSLADVESAYALGAVDFIAKPVAVEILRAKVNVFVKLRQANQALRDRDLALAIKDRHISVLAHEMWNPLNTITLASSALLMLASEARTRRSLVRVRAAAARMQVMIEDLLEFAREGHGAMPIRRASVDLGRLCRELVDQFQGEDDRQTIDLLASEGDLVGEWDGARLQQAISNLIGNALQHGRGVARVSLRDLGAEVELVVGNDGPPIPNELLALIFEPFERGDWDSAGLGLGLYIVKAVATGHGGTVTVRSSAEEGTAFTMRLPRRLASPREAPRAVPNAPLSEPRATG